MLFRSLETWIDAIIMQDIYQRTVLWRQHGLVINKTPASFSPPALCCLLNPLAPPSSHHLFFVFLFFWLLEYSNRRMIRCVAMFLMLLWLGCWQNNHWHTFRSLQKLLPFGFVSACSMRFIWQQWKNGGRLKRRTGTVRVLGSISGRARACSVGVFESISMPRTKTLYEFQRRMLEECCSPGKAQMVYSDDPGDLPNLAPHIRESVQFKRGSRSKE